MLNVGLTGGIGSGKSTVADRLVAHGAVLIDSDRLAREVVAPGTTGLDAVVAEFGQEVLGAGGALDRPALAARVFADDEARARLNSIVHPLVRDRSVELLAAAPAEAVVVHDVPLLVEGGMAPGFQLVLVVQADAEHRVRRLVEQRGMDEADARARIEAQAGDEQRRAAADVLLDNSGTPEQTRATVDALWADRLHPFEQNLRHEQPPQPGPLRLVAPDPDWPAQGERLAARVDRAVGDAAARTDHIGSTAVPGLASRQRVDLQLALREPASEGLAGALSKAGFVPSRKGCYEFADPGRPATLQVQPAGTAPWRQALLLRDWLRADAAVRTEYEAIKRAAIDRYGGDAERYTEAKESWFEAALPRAHVWADTNAWKPPAA